jgi:hypothetical protein
MKRRHNIFLWIGFVLVLLAVLTYIPIFALFASTRDVPWVNYLLFLAGAILLALGLRRAFGQPQIYRGKIRSRLCYSTSRETLGFYFSSLQIFAAALSRDGTSI